MKVADAAQMRKIDRDAESLYGIPKIILMENAGIKLYRHIIEKCGDEKRVCIICGKGNNGGDCYVAARHLYSQNHNITIFSTAEEQDLKGDALVNYRIAKNMGIDIKSAAGHQGLEEFAASVQNCDILVDGLIGTGIRGELTGIYREIVDVINKYAAYVISVDIPSGVDSDTGRIMGVCVKADVTVTFALPKIGLYTYPGAGCAGQVIAEDISIPLELVYNQDININLIEQDDVSKLFPERSKDTNKGIFGRALIIGGSKDMMGAAAMCTMSALRCGAGLVETAVPSCIQERVSSAAVEAMVHGLDDKDGRFLFSCADKIMEMLSRSTSFAFGPGISLGEDLYKLLQWVIEETQVPGVIDADGLNLLSQNVELLRKAKSSMVLTPHPGEMARLLGRDTAYVQSNRIGCAREFSTKYGVVLVLKGASTVIASPDGQVFINPTGNPGMAKGGSGDVLTGMIVSLIAQGFKPLDAAKAGVFLHGLAGDMADRNMGEYAMNAGDIIEYISAAIKAVSGIR